MADWKAEHQGGDIYRFTNVSGQKAVMITLQEVGNVTLAAVGAGEFDNGAVSGPKDPGEHFDWSIKRAHSVGTAGVRINWTVPPGQNNTWVFNLPE